MQLSIVSGVVATEAAEFRASHPLNIEPVIVESGISKGQLRTAAGAEPFAAGPGVDRGGIEWSGAHLRIMGSKLVRVDAAVTPLGEVGGQGPVSLDYSFDRLIVRSGARLFYWNGAALTRVTDPDLGAVVDALWIDGYTMATDGRFVVVTELNDPMQVKPLKYGSAEADPDPVTGLIKVRGEAYVCGRHTIQVFQNVGGAGFPFATVPGATISTGCVSASAKVAFGNSFAFVGSARGDALGVFVAGAGTADRISVRAVEAALAAEPDPAAIELERRVGDDELRLFVHLSAETWVFLARASEAAGEPIWYRCRSGAGKPYRLRHAVQAGRDVIVGDRDGPGLARLTTDTPGHFGETVEWSFDAGLLYNGARGAIVDAVELVGLTGRGAVDDPGSVFLSMTADGTRYTTERAVALGRTGERSRRLQWRPHLRMRTYLGFRFRGYGSGVAGFAACEARIRPLAV